MWIWIVMKLRSVAILSTRFECLANLTLSLSSPAPSAADNGDFGDREFVFSFRNSLAENLFSSSYPKHCMTNAEKSKHSLPRNGFWWRSIFQTLIKLATKSLKSEEEKLIKSIQKSVLIRSYRLSSFSFLPQFNKNRPKNLSNANCRRRHSTSSRSSSPSYCNRWSI